MIKTRKIYSAAFFCLLPLFFLFCVTGYQSPYIGIIDAVENGDVRDVKYFISRGANVNATRSVNIVRGNELEEYEEPLIMRANYSKVALIKYLVSQGACVNARSASGGTPLHRATGDSMELMNFLIDHGADVNAQCISGSAPLHIAAHYDVSFMRLLIDRGAIVDVHSEMFGTPLHILARFRSDLDMWKCLIENGADVNMKDGKGMTPLDILEIESEGAHDGGVWVAGVVMITGKQPDPERVEKIKEILRAAGGKRGDSL
ncbi:MAG: ankyrin repeat domain-containing protein [Planctomycetaceae bacterium]|nr:ankyrin repeat domain-containing protein [Planctomycetaceae bacterium]